jgi:Zn-dependent protease
VGFTHLSLAILLAAIAFFGRVAVQKIVGLSMGFQGTFTLWWAGLIISLVVVFISYGFVPLVLPGGLVMTMMVRHRLGEFRYGFNYWEQALMGYAGSVGNVILALLFKFFLLFSPGNWFLQKGVLMNVIIALCLLLPLPKLDGIHLFFSSRLWYFFLTGIILGISILIFFTGIILTIIGGIAIGAVIYLLYYIMYEMKT